MDVRELLATPLDELCAEARAVRDRSGRRLVTYSPKVFIPLTKLCRDVCHYCTFAAPPKRGERAYLTLDEVLDDRPRRRGGRLPRGAVHARRQAGAALPARRARSSPRSAARRRSSTSPHAAGAVLDETGLLPHLNPGVLTRDDFARSARYSRLDGDDARDDVGAAVARAAARTSARRTSSRPRGSRRFGCAGEERVPFTTGILIGIGETREERIDALRAIADAHARTATSRR